MARRFSGRIKLITGLLDVNGVVHVADSHHQSHLDERSYVERVNENGDEVMARRSGASRAQLTYRSSASGDDPPAAAAYAPTRED